MHNRRFSFILFVLIILCASILCSCGTGEVPDVPEETHAPLNAETIRIGMLLPSGSSDEISAGYYNSLVLAASEMGTGASQIDVKFNVKGSGEQQLNELIESGYRIIFAMDRSYADAAAAVSKTAELVDFCVLGADYGEDVRSDNLHSFYSEAYKTSYLAGCAAGRLLRQMVSSAAISSSQAVIGYYAVRQDAVSTSDFTAILLGARSSASYAVMSVRYDSGDGAEKSLTELKDAGCKIIATDSQSGDVRNFCEENGLALISTDGIDSANTLCNRPVDWHGYFYNCIDCILSDKKITYDYMIPAAPLVIGSAADSGAADAIEDVEEAVSAGTRHVFMTNEWKISGTIPEDAHIYDGFYHECEYTSAPTFNYIIDGVTLLNRPM